MYCNGFIEIAHFENVNKESCFLVILSLKTLEIREPFSIRSSKSGNDEKNVRFTLDIFIRAFRFSLAIFNTSGVNLVGVKIKLITIEIIVIFRFFFIRVFIFIKFITHTKVQTYIRFYN